MSARPEQEYRVGAIYLGAGVHRTTTTSGWYYLGAVPTLHGFVAAYADDNYAHLSFICDGAEHHLIRHRSFTQRGLVTIARRFADDVVNGRLR